MDRCAHAVSQDDGRLANDLIDELWQHSSAYGNVHQRLAHYYTAALVSGSRHPKAIKFETQY